MKHGKNIRKTTQPIWFRIGGYLHLTKDEIELFKHHHDDVTDKQFLAILRRGLDLCGDTYPHDHEECLNDENCIDLREQEVVVISKSSYNTMKRQLKAYKDNAEKLAACQMDRHLDNF